MLTADQVDRCLAQVAEVGAACQLTDAHVHPLEVLLDAQRFQPSAEVQGLHSATATAYIPPAPDALRATQSGPPLDPALQRKLLQLTSARAYAHTGPRPLGDHLAAARVHRCLLLPVAGPDRPDPLPRVAAMFGDDPRFALACCPGNDVPVADLEGAVRDAVAAHGVCAVKIHPAVTGIDTSRSAGLERIETLLTAAGRYGLTAVVHGGMSRNAPDPSGAGWGALDRWTDVDWSCTDRPVVIAHAGAFDVDEADAVQDVLPAMAALLERHGHLRVDTSGLMQPVLVELLRRVQPERVVFGSDALYFAPWQAMVGLVRALELAGQDVTAALATIAGENPSHLLGEESGSCFAR